MLLPSCIFASLNTTCPHNHSSWTQHAHLARLIFTHQSKGVLRTFHMVRVSKVMSASWEGSTPLPSGPSHQIQPEFLSSLETLPLLWGLFSLPFLGWMYSPSVERTKEVVLMPFQWLCLCRWCTHTFLGGCKITADGDCSHEIKRRLLLGRKVMTNLDSIVKSRDIALPAKFRLVKAMVFPILMYGCECWTVKKAEHWRIDAFELWSWRRLLRVPWTARRLNQFVLKEISPECLLEGQMLKLKLQYFGHLLWGTD